MTSKIGSILGSDNNFNADQSYIDKARQVSLLSNTDEQNQTSINHLKNRTFGMPDDRIIEKTPLRQIVESLAKNPINENLKGETVKIIVNPKKSPEKMSADDYRQAVWQAVFKQAGHGMLTGGELRQAVSLIKSADSSITSSGLDLENMRRSDKLPGVLTVDTDKYTIELAKRAGEAVLGNAQNEAEKAAAAKNEAQSTTNQMLIDPLKLGGNVPVRWLERILNTPKELLRQIDKGEILPGSSTAKWIGGKIGEYITGKPAPPMKTASEAIEELTGAKLPAIPDVELPRPFEYKTDKYKADGKTGEDVGATAIDLFLLKRGMDLKNPKVIKSEPIGAMNPALRRIYVNKVKNLATEAREMKEAGQSAETIARTLHGKRRQLGIEYKDLTPPDILKKVFERNMEKYNDAWGPSIQHLRNKGKTWEQIIESACRPGGKDLGF